MSNSLYNRLLTAILCCLPLTAMGQMTLVKGGKARARIICTGDTMKSHRAAQLLNTFVERISGTTLPQTDALTSPRPRRGDIIIGEPTTASGEDGFQLTCRQGQLHVRSGGGSGSINGIVALLELARTNPCRDVEEVAKALDLFEQRTAEYGIPTLNERRNKPSDYCQLYRQRFLPTGRANQAAHAKVTWNKPPAARYRGIADTALTDGLYCGTTFVESWVGWEGEDADFVLDLGEEKTFSSIEIDFLHQLGAWILLPKGGRMSVSTDGNDYHPFGTFQFAEDRDISVKFVGGRAEVPAPVTARYIHIEVETLGNCPNWHYGVGYPAWFFMDEIVVE